MLPLIIVAYLCTAHASKRLRPDGKCKESLHVCCFSQGMWMGFHALIGLLQ
uniref:Uncharacterized protein n=1 Tax=Arundo donax TaxID=35708 RepID=A0A0A9CE26_ARUDO